MFVSKFDAQPFMVTFGNEWHIIQNVFVCARTDLHGKSTGWSMTPTVEIISDLDNLGHLSMAYILWNRELFNKVVSKFFELFLS